MAKPKSPKILEKIMQEIMTKPTVPLWPHVGVVYDIGRNGVYEMARRGDIETVRVGHLLRVITAPLRKQLGIEAR
jgi:hypothetical protein